MKLLPGELDGERFLRALGRFGWTVASQRGSHRKLTHPHRPGRLVVAFHSKIGRRAVLRTLREAHIEVEAFLEQL